MTAPSRLVLLAATVVLVLLTLALFGPASCRAALWAPRLDVGGGR